MTDLTPEQQADIERRFDVAISWVQNKEIECPIRPTGRQSLYFYGRYKQAKQGDNTAPKPSMFYPVRRYMWFAHEKQKGKSALQAKREYVAEIDRLCREFDVASLPPRLHDSADLFFSQFYNTPHHPFADVCSSKTMKDEEERKEQTPASPLRPTLQPSSAVSSPRLQPSTSASRSASPAAHRIASNVSTPARAGGMSPPAVDGPQAWPMAQRNNLRSPTAASEGARSGAVSQAASPAPTPSKLRTDETVAAGAGSPAPMSPAERPSAATSPATAAAETRDKELLAQRLLDLQLANQTKMQQLEAQLQRSGANAAALAARFATPSRGAQPFTPVHPPSSTASSHPHTFTSLDPSSPFATTWTSSGLKPRPRAANGSDGRAVFASPDQPFPQFLTPYSQARTAAPEGPQRVIEAVPFPAMDAQGADGAAQQRRSVASTPISSLPSSPAPPAAASAAASPATVTAVAAAAAVGAPSSNIVTPAPSSPTPTAGLVAPAPLSPSPSSSSDSAFAPSSPSPSDLLSLLSALDAEQSAQASQFEAAERQWRARLADLDARRRLLQQQQRGGAGEADTENGAISVVAAIPASESVAAPSVVDAAESALAAVSAGPSSPPPALELSVAVVPGSLLHHTLNIAKVAVPVGVGAYAAFKLYTHYARRMRLRQ